MMIFIRLKEMQKGRIKLMINEFGTCKNRRENYW